MIRVEAVKKKLRTPSERWGFVFYDGIFPKRKGLNHLAKGLSIISKTKRTVMKMKFFSFCAGAVLLTTLQTYAQSGAQIRAGLNLANVSITDNGRVDDANQLTSFHIGLVGDVPLAGNALSFQPGILFTGKGAKTVTEYPSISTTRKATTNPYYIEIPANLVFKAPLGGSSRLFAGAGPYLGIGIAGKNKVQTVSPIGTSDTEREIEFSNDDPTTINEEEGAGFGIMKRFDYGLNGTAGIEGKNLVLGVNYGLGLAKLQSGGNSSADDKNKHRVLGFFLGIKL